MANGDHDMSNVPAWLQLFLAGLSGAVISIISVVKLWSSFNTRLQKLENHNLIHTIDTQIAVDRHNNLYPMLQTRVFAVLDRMEDENKQIGKDIATLLERDRLDQRMEKVISALNKAAMKDQV